MQFLTIKISIFCIKNINNNECKAIDYETFMKIAKDTLLSNALTAIGIGKDDCE